MSKFPAPQYNTVPDSDPQVKRVDLDNMEIASRPNAVKQNETNQFAIRHVKNSK